MDDILMALAEAVFDLFDGTCRKSKRMRNRLRRNRT